MSEILIWLVEDDESVRQATSGLLKSLGFEVEFSSSAEDFLTSARLHDTSCLILDVQMPGMSGLRLQSYLAALGCHIPIIFTTAYPDQGTRARALQAGAVDFLYKPFGDEALLNAIRSALKVNDKNGQP